MSVTKQVMRSCTGSPAEILPPPRRLQVRSVWPLVDIILHSGEGQGTNSESFHATLRLAPPRFDRCGASRNSPTLSLLTTLKQRKDGVWRPLGPPRPLGRLTALRLARPTFNRTKSGRNRHTFGRPTPTSWARHRLTFTRRRLISVKLCPGSTNFGPLLPNFARFRPELARNQPDTATCPKCGRNSATVGPDPAIFLE